MAERWRVLILLFAVRVTMAVQFQSTASLSPLIMERHGIGLTEIGILIGLYLSPGIVFALPGGAIGKRLGDARAVAAGMGLMVAGGLMTVLLTSWEGQLAGRLIAGTGGVVLNVLMSKMVTDWFAGREIATAMGIFVNSWPVGIAAALLILPGVATAGGLGAAMAVVTGLVAVGLAALLAFYRVPPSGGPPPPQALPRGRTMAGVLTAGAIWGLYNAALGMIFGFGPAMLAERGWSLSEASGTTSLVLWLVAVSVPLGGVLADRTGRRDAVLLIGLAAFATCLAAAPGSAQVLALFVLLGLVGGLPAGPIMSLPADVLGAGTRALGMGLFFTVFYAMIVAAPILAGWLSERSGTAGTAFTMGAVLLVLAGLLTLGWQQAGRRTPWGR